MLTALLGLSLSPLLMWSGPPAGPETPAATVEEPAAASSEADPKPPTLPESPGSVPAEAPAAEAPAPDPAPAPAVAVEPVEPPAPEPVADVPVEAPLSSAQFDSPAPGLEADLHDDYVTIRPPSWRGTGMLVAAGLTFATAITFQGIDTLVCGECATGGIERAFMATTIGLAAGGGAVRAHADAYDDTALRRNRPNTRRALITGAVLTGAGAAMGLVNEGLWWRCVFDGSGPYRLEAEEFSWNRNFDCRYGLSRGLMDLATGATSAGVGMMTWALVYRRDARAYQRARVLGVTPTVGRNRWGLSIEGRF